MEEYIEELRTLLIQYAPKVVAALMLLIIGLWVIKVVAKAINKLMEARDLDQSLRSFLASLIKWTLKIFLFVTVAGQLGVETTSFAAIIAAAGLAIGMALQGSLSNFAGGALIMIFRPFKVGDYIDAQGEQGTVKEIQIFTTKLSTPDNKEIIIPNGALSNGNITNYSSKDTRRVDITFGVGYDSDIKETKELLLNIISNTPFTLMEPAPQVVLSELGESSINFKTRTWVKTAEYWDAHGYILEEAKIALDKAGIDIPYPHVVEIQKKG